MKYVLPALMAIWLLASCGEEKPAQEKGAAKTEKSKGEQLFNNYCMQCHGVNEDRIGPALKGSLSRWDNDTARITKFIRNARESIQNGDPRAVKVAQEWNNALMTPMPFLSDDDIADILEYIHK